LAALLAVPAVPSGRPALATDLGDSQLMVKGEDL
jgi:hypothetical protein